MILITGVTGCLGREILRYMAARTSERFALIVRRSKNATVQARVQEILAYLYPEGIAPSLLSRIEIIEGDLALPQFGLGLENFARLAADTTEIFHCAASTHLAQSIQKARINNVATTENVLAFGRLVSKSRLFRCFHHVSTAYVAGDIESTVRAQDFSLNRNFKNAYEQSKAEAEALIHAASATMPTCIYRPSIIVGRSDTGSTPSFDVIYVPARLLVQGLVSALPASNKVPFDLVPVDYVAEAIVGLAGYSPDGRNHLNAESRSSNIYHLSAGVGRESNPWEMIEALIDTYNRFRPKGWPAVAMPTFLSTEVISRVQQSLTKACSSVLHFELKIAERLGILPFITPFFPYLLRNPQFDTRETIHDLQNILEQPPLFTTYSEKIFRYCIDTDWGRGTTHRGTYLPALSV